MPQKLLAANLIVCENVLEEKDNVLSVIRIVDVYKLAVNPAIPITEQGVIVGILVQLKSQIGDTEEHAIKMNLVRPDGQPTSLIDTRVVITSTERGTPGGYTIKLNLGVVPHQFGTHYVTLNVDGEEFARTPFTLQPQPRAD